MIRTMVVAAAVIGLGNGAVAAQSDPPIDSSLARATFDSVWSRIKSSHYDTALVGARWDRAADSLRPAAVGAGTLGGLRRALAALLATLRESHHVIIPGEIGGSTGSEESPGDGTLGLTVRIVDGAALVARVDSGGAGWLAGARPGWRVDSIGRIATTPLIDLGRTLGAQGRSLATTLLAGLTTGPADRDVAVRFSTPSGSRRVLIRPREAEGTTVRFGLLPPLKARVWSERRAIGSDCVGVIGFSVWMPPILPAVDEAVDDFRSCSGLVFDLRGNPGGIVGLLMGVSGHVLDRPDTLGTMRNRTSTIHFVANPRRVSPSGRLVTPFGGPVALVVDELTASASELFAAGLQSLGRARVFGSTTAGQALPAVALRLPSGDVLMHVIADFVTPTGRRVEATGVIPDEPVPLTQGSLLAGRDLPLEAAIAWIAKERR